jgi:hypothetical protein
MPFTARTVPQPSSLSSAKREPLSSPSTWSGSLSACLRVISALEKPWSSNSATIPT